MARRVFCWVISWLGVASHMFLASHDSAMWRLGHTDEADGICVGEAPASDTSTNKQNHLG